MARTSVLVVEHDVEERTRIGELLEREGFETIFCPGPLSPDYTCLGGRGLPCPLAREADVVVLNVRLASDVIMRGSPGWQLLVYYMELGKPVVAMSSSDDSVHPLTDKRVISIQRPADGHALVKAVRKLAAVAYEEGVSDVVDDLAR